MLLMLFKVTVVLLTALVVSSMLRRRSAGTRYLVWLVALFAALVVPWLSVWSPLPVRVLPPAAPLRTTNAIHLEPQAPPTSQVPAASTGPSEAVAVIPPTSRTIDVGGMLLALWSLGVLLLVGRLMIGAMVVRQLVRRSQPLDQPDWQRPLYEIADRLGLDEAPRLVENHRIKMPFATGLRRPVIVLPAESSTWSHERRCAVLIHEFAHIKRGDLLGHLVGGIACALYWFHPLVWTAARHLRAESERAA